MTGFSKIKVLNFFTFVTALHNEGVGELCFVSLVYRHGDRAPTGTYPTDPYHNDSFWPNGWGQLTTLGKLQMYELGKWIRHNYWDFLPEKYNSSDIYVRSTDVDRTLMSAYCNLAGLYEFRCNKGKEELSWQPVPVHTIPVTMDSVLAGHKSCAAYQRLYNEVLKSEEVYVFHHDQMSPVVQIFA